jgi:hypothetical protein
MTMVPNPRWSGACMGGPPRSVHVIVSGSPSSRQRTSTWPSSVDSAPYLPALVASSCSARPTASAAVAFKCNFGPCTVIRDPMRSAKCASWARAKSSSSAARCWSRSSRSWRAFAVARFARIYPLFALTTLATVAVVTLAGATPAFYVNPLILSKIQAGDSCHGVDRLDTQNSNIEALSKRFRNPNQREDAGGTRPHDSRPAADARTDCG